jgi:hypothetical protein
VKVCRAGQWSACIDPDSVEFDQADGGALE